MNKFSESMFNSYRFNITNSPTVSNLTLKIYKSQFMPVNDNKDSNIIILKGE